MNDPHERLRHHVTGAIERGEATAIEAVVKQDFTKPAENDATGHCVHCGRDNRGYEGKPCADDCPMYWEAIGITHPDHSAVDKIPFDDGENF